jgi:hypothetical protein
MIRTRISLIFFAASGLLMAQSTGGWRRAGDAPATPAPNQYPAQQSADRPADPEPVDRSDAYGQPAPGQNAPGQRQQPPAYGVPAELTLTPGTYLTVRMEQFLSSNRNQQGDTFVASLAQPVVVDGVIVAQRGQNVYGRVSEAVNNSGGRPSRLGLELTGMTLVDGTQTQIRSQVVGRNGTTAPAGEQVGTVATTTAVGAAVGGIADYGRGAAIGAGVGAMAGIIGVILTRNHATEIYPETVLTFQVTAPVAISTARAPQAFRYVGPDEYDRPYVVQAQPRPAPAPRPVYGYPAPAPYPYPYPYWGPSVYIGVGSGWYGPGWGYRYYGYRGPYRRWR